MENNLLTPEFNARYDNPFPNHDEIAALAHQIWLERGDEPGSPESDWFEAERRLISASRFAAA